MSEYQYYEFAAIDRPLTPAERAQLRTVSTRADITPVGFVNHYEWGDLKADPADWMRRYFDAFVYTANWCSCRFALRVPLATFRKSELEPLRSQDALTIEANESHWIIDWSLDDSENHDRFGMDDGSRWMRRLVPLRDELLRGDLRPIYLGWLAAASLDAVPDEALEPEVPPRLSTLSAPQQALVEFLEIDPDMLNAAMAASTQASGNAAAFDDRVDAWLETLPRQELTAILKLIAQGQGHVAEREVKSRHAAWLKAQRPSRTAAAPRRSVGQLRALAQSASSARQVRKAAEHARREAERRQQREATLRLLMADVDNRWSTIDTLAQRGSASAYEQAVRALTDLAEGYALVSSRKAFDRELRRLLMRHATRGALLRRLADAGLWSG